MARKSEVRHTRNKHDAISDKVFGWAAAVGFIRGLFFSRTVSCRLCSLTSKTSGLSKHLVNGLVLFLVSFILVGCHPLAFFLCLPLIQAAEDMTLFGPGRTKVLDDKYRPTELVRTSIRGTIRVVADSLFKVDESSSQETWKVNDTDGGVTYMTIKKNVPSSSAERATFVSYSPNGQIRPEPPPDVRRFLLRYSH
jgi:hypothetical protein